MRLPSSLFAIVMVLVFSLGLTMPAEAGRVVVDMAGHPVTVPDTIHRVVTLGPVPVLNSFIFALGKGDTIVNGLPGNLGGPRWKYQYLIAPTLKDRPIVQGPEGGPAVEDILALAPDAVLTMDMRTVEAMARVGLPVIYLSWRRPEDAKAVLRLLAELYGTPEAAERYGRYFDATLARVAARIDRQPEAGRPRVLYASLGRLTQPHLIAEWWIARAGGRSVTSDGRTAESLTFSLEQLLAWDPEVLILANPAEVADAYADPRLAGIAAVRNRRVHAIPMGAHLWGNRTIEQPLTVLWAARIIRPDLFPDLDLDRELATFYAAIFRFDLTPEMIAEILAGRPGL